MIGPLSLNAGMGTVRPEDLDEDAGGVLDAISIAFAILTSLFLTLRFYAKSFVAAPFGLDDVFLVSAYIVNLAMCAMGLIMVRVGGVGRHDDFLEEHDPDKLEGWAKCILAFEIIYFASMALPKMAIIFLYLRVLNWKGPMRQLAYVLLVLLACTGLSFIVTACFQCRPIAFWWDRSIPGGVCIDVQTFFHAQSLPGIILDVIIIVMPLSTIWDLKMPLARRLALVLIFAIGSFGIVASILRAIAFFGTAAFADRTFASVALVGWSIIETGTYIITNCLASLKPLVTHFIPAWLRKAMRWTVASASNSMSGHSHSRNQGRGKAPDEIELTGSSRSQKPYTSSMEYD